MGSIPASSRTKESGSGRWSSIKLISVPDPWHFSTDPDTLICTSNRSRSVCGSCSFRQWPSKHKKKKIPTFMLINFWRDIYIILQRQKVLKKSQNSRNKGLMDPDMGGPKTCCIKIGQQRNRIFTFWIHFGHILSGKNWPGRESTDFCTFTPVRCGLKIHFSFHLIDSNQGRYLKFLPQPLHMYIFSFLCTDAMWSSREAWTQTTLSLNSRNTKL